MFSKRSNTIEESFVSLLLVAMTLLVFFEVVSRFVFNIGFQWLEEVTLTLGAWFVLFGASYGVKVGAHIGVDAFVQSLPKKARKTTAIAAVVLCLAYCCLFISGSWTYLAKMYSIGITMEDVHVPQMLVELFDDETLWEIFRIDSEEPLMPLWIAQSVLLIGFASLFYRFFQLLLKIISGKAEGFKFADEAEESMHLVQNESSENDVPENESAQADDISAQDTKEKR
ncbi:TRAP transporter small permease subunit [Colwellia sp. KU-HH00111]|uniref:TRAP transporter small permease n=1 Tax=Colwellia sp. KU-HH00111 TaxID=3127652 RepID=UPI00310212B3